MTKRSDLTEAEKEVVDLCRNSERPFITTMEVAEKFSITQQAAHRRLSILHDDGVFNRAKVGAGAVVWWLECQAPSSSDISAASC
jgi:predicted ArsR family transcriptional regulator